MFDGGQRAIDELRPVASQNVGDQVGVADVEMRFENDDDFLNTVLSGRRQSGQHNRRKGAEEEVSGRTHTFDFMHKSVLGHG